jgi:beta-glucosidase
MMTCSRFSTSERCPGPRPPGFGGTILKHAKTGKRGGGPLLLLLLLLLIPAAAAGQAARYTDPSVPLAQRVADLVSRMTLEEKVSQMMDVASPIDRLGVPEYNWWNEALHGVARSGLATSFPQAIGLAATWNESLLFRTATVISDEARAKHHEYLRNGTRLRYQGLTIWSPNINLFRDPRWGRGQETYGEDPYLTGRLAVQFVRGLQGNDPRYLKTVATVKHFAVHSGPEPERHSFDAVVSERDLRESYLPHFEAGIREGGAYSLMCAYNRVFGKAACGSELLLQNILRGEWGFQGFVVSDCGAINDIYQNHKIVPTPEEASALAVRTGTDLDCGRVYRSLVDAVRRGLIPESEIDVAVTRLFTARFRLGMFDPPARVPYAQIPYRILDQPAHRALARQVARESMVLLKNDGNLLPLRKNLRTIAVIGPNADQWMTLLGNYYGMPADPVTPLRGIREAVAPATRVVYARGAEFADSFPTFDVVPGNVLLSDNRPGLRAEYFANHELSGSPSFTTRDSTLNINWRSAAPRSELNGDDFSVRWTGVLRPQRTGEYRLGLIGTMKFELYLNDSLAVRSVYSYRDEFGDPRLRAGDAVRLEAGRTYRVRVEAHESYGDAQMQLVWTDPGRDLTAEAVRAAQSADAVVLVLGLTPRLEGEEMNVQIQGFRGGDRTSLDLPGAQQRLLERVVAVGKPTVLVLLNGSALSINWAQQRVPAILEAWYPGQAGGSAIADVLFGDYNPAGRLPVTFYKSASDLPPFEDYSMRGRTYRFFDGQPLYPFGHGLSYTTFEYANLRSSRDTISRNGSLVISADIRNTGARAGDEVVQLYVQHLGATVTRPLKELKGYQRIALRPAERRTVTFTLPASQLAYWDSTSHNWAVSDGRVRVLMGASSLDIRLADTINVVSRVLEPQLPAANSRR